VDRPGVLAAVTGLLAKHDVNIATMHLYRQGRGGKAAMVIEIDGDLKQEAKEELQRSHPALMRVIFIPLAEGDLI